LSSRPNGGEELFNWDKALQHVEGDVDFLKEIYEIFLEEIPERIEAFQKALDENDIDRIVSLAHSLKGVSLTVGAYSCHELSAELEKAARKYDEKRVRELYRQLETLLRKIEVRISHMNLS
jgi:HPt (histidine-containing phosphotransfer) domain-containing protein